MIIIQNDFSVVLKGGLPPAHLKNRQKPVFFNTELSCYKQISGAERSCSAYNS